jgi:hypothetical protein
MVNLLLKYVVKNVNTNIGDKMVSHELSSTVFVEIVAILLAMGL